jgi:phospho-N-acetylmuramoyl-pentapeptide-transferase
LGGFIGALALLTGTGFILPIIAFVAVIEVLSVIIQVISFKLFGIRVFKVSPLHHHFERAEGIDYKFILSSTEWPEPTITIRFWIVSAIFGLIGLLAYFK